MSDQLTDSDQRAQTICLMILTAICLAALMYWLRDVIVPFVLSLFFSITLTPLIDVQVRYLRFPRIVALITALVLGFLALVLLVGIVAAALGDFARNAAQYEGQVRHLLQKASDVGLLGKFDFSQRLGIDLLSQVPVESIQNVIGRVTGAVTSVLSNLFLVLIFSVFILIGGQTREKPRIGIRGDIERQVKKYVVTKVMVSIATGFLVFLILRFLGIPFAISFGAFAFLLNFIPNVGSIISTLLPIPVVLLLPNTSVTTAALAILLPAVVHNTIGNLVEPRLMGKELDLHPITVLFSLVFWGFVWGFNGMILAVPVTAVVKIILENIDRTKPIAHVLAGRLDLVLGED